MITKKVIRHFLFTCSKNHASAGVNSMDFAAMITVFTRFGALYKVGPYHLQAHTIRSQAFDGDLDS